MFSLQLGIRNKDFWNLVARFLFKLEHAAFIKIYFFTYWNISFIKHKTVTKSWQYNKSDNQWKTGAPLPLQCGPTAIGRNKPLSVWNNQGIWFHEFKCTCTISDLLFLFLCFSVSEMDSGMVKVKEWNQSYYGHDSGIQSGATTIRDDDGDYKTTTRYVTTTTVTKEQPGETKQS